MYKIVFIQKYTFEYCLTPITHFMKTQLLFFFKRTFLLFLLSMACSINKASALSSPLGIIVTDLKGQQTIDHIKLNWQFSNTIPGFQLFIEKSEDGVNWKNITLCSNGQTEYEDNEPQNGFQYYRLKQVDATIDISYTNIIAVEFKNTNQLTWSLFPNPAKETISLKLNSNQTGPFYLKLYNHNLKFIESIEPSFQNIIQIDVSDKPKGLYFLEINYNDKTEKLRFIKN